MSESEKCAVLKLDNYSVKSVNLTKTSRTQFSMSTVILRYLSFLSCCADRNKKNTKLKRDCKS